LSLCRNNPQQRLPTLPAWLGFSDQGRNAMLNQLTQTQKYGLYAFVAGVLTVVLFLLLRR
jgi:hypothetical protein